MAAYKVHREGRVSLQVASYIHMYQSCAVYEGACLCMYVCIYIHIKAANLHAVPRRVGRFCVPFWSNSAVTNRPDTHTHTHTPMFIVQLPHL